jgi:hypothetical protein
MPILPLSRLTGQTGEKAPTFLRFDPVHEESRGCDWN